MNDFDDARHYAYAMSARMAVIDFARSVVDGEPAVPEGVFTDAEIELIARTVRTAYRLSRESRIEKRTIQALHDSWTRLFPRELGEEVLKIAAFAD